MAHPPSVLTAPRPRTGPAPTFSGTSPVALPDPTWDATFIALDPPRASFFALWNVEQSRAIPLIAPAGWKHSDVQLITPSGGRQTVTVARLAIRDAIDLFASLPASAPVKDSVKAWAAVLRSCLTLIAQGRVVPWVSPQGWDSWRVDPLDGQQLEHVEALARALPSVAHAAPAGDSPHRHVASHPEFAIRACWDAVADRLLRAPGSARLSASPLFTDLAPTRVRHLRPWVSDVAGRLCRSAHLALLVLPPIDRSEATPSEPGVAPAGTEGHATDQWRVQFGLRPTRDPSLRVSAADLWRVEDDVLAKFGDQIDLDFLSALRQAAEICPALAPALERERPRELALDDAAIDTFLDSVDDLVAAGIDVRWSADLVSCEVERRLVIGTDAPGDSLAAVADFDSLVQVDWEFLLDGLALTKDELVALSEAKRSIVPVRGRWVRLSARARRSLMAPPPTLTSGQALAALLGNDLHLGGLFGRSEGSDQTLDGASAEPVPVRPVGSIAGLVDKLAELMSGQEAPEPQGLATELRPYQRRGLAWMAGLVELGLGGCLADDMGLGKTVQVLALHQLRQSRTLVVCPTSVVANWQREANRFLPDVGVRRYHGPARSLADLAPNELVITTYGVLRSDTDTLAAVEWDLCIADEAQQAKNPRSRTARALRKVPAGSRIALSGTPVENRLTELWSIIDWAVPGLLGTRDMFRRQVAVPIERDDNPEVTEALYRLLAPFLLRRVKSDPTIAPELPAKTEHDVVVPLTAEQVTLYHATVGEILRLVQQAEGVKRHGLVLKLLTSLKQITNHPAQYLGESGPLAGRSGKLEALDHLLDNARAGGEATLVFSQYVAMGKLLVRHLTDRGVDVALVHGGLSVAARQSLVDRFQAGAMPVLVLSLKAAGTGLNLTRASQVIHYDRWWNPAVEDQATDRAYRIGQDKPVTVHRIITEGTVEDRVAELLKQKRRLADRVVGAGESWLSSLDNQALADLVSLDPGIGLDGLDDEIDCPDYETEQDGDLELTGGEMP